MEIFYLLPKNLFKFKWRLCLFVCVVDLPMTDSKGQVQLWGVNAKCQFRWVEQVTSKYEN